MRASALPADSPFEVLTESLGIKIDLRYAHERNFTGRCLYPQFNQLILHQEAAQQFRQAIQDLRVMKPSYQFLVLDGLRPHSVQKELYEFVLGTPMERYVAHPERGSVHNYGMAIDLTLLNEQSVEVDMGTEFDFFGDLAEPKHEKKYLATGQLTSVQHENRLILRQVMVGAGFHQLSTEWWHYNAKAIHEIKEQQYPRVNSL